MRRLKIGPRLTLSFATIVLLMIVGSAVGLWQLNIMHIQAQRLQQTDVEVEAIVNVHNSALILKDRLRDLIDAQDSSRIMTEVPNRVGDVIYNLDRTIELLETSPTKDENSDYATYLQQLDTARISLPSRVDSIIQLVHTEDWLGAHSSLAGPISQDSERIGDLVASIRQTVATEQTQALNNMEQAQQQALTAIIVTGLLTLAAAIGLGIIVTRSISQPLAHLNAGANALARHAFDYRLTITGDDELTHLSRVFNNSTAQLAELYTNLEERVLQRTQALQDSTEELHHRYLQLETTIGVGKRVTSILDDAPTLLHQVVELIREQYGYYFVGIFLPDASGTYIVAKAGTGEAGQSLCAREFRLKIGQVGITGWVAKHGRPLRIDNVEKDERYVTVAEVPGTRSEFALPLMVGQKIVGVLDLQSERLRAFPMEDMPILQALADQIAIAIHNTSLYEREKERRQLAETLYASAHALSRTLDLSEVLTLILEHLAAIVSYDRAAVLLRKGEILEFVAVKGFPDEIDPHQLTVPIHHDEGDIFQKIYQSQQPLSIPDVLQSSGWQNIKELRQARAWLGVPLIRQGKVIGMLSLTREVPDAYDEDQVQLAATFAAQAAIVLENARLYSEITRFSQYLEETVTERTQDLLAAYSQLELLDRTKSDFIQIAAHELRTPLTILRGYSQILLKDPAIQANETHSEMLSSVHQGAIRLHEIINSMLDVTKIDNRALKLNPEPLALSFIIKQVCQDFDEVLKEREQLLEQDDLSGLPMVDVDPDGLKKVFHHLIANAIKYTPDGGKITITGYPFTNEYEMPVGVKISISDNGIGIDPQFQDLIFTKFYQTGEVALHSTSKTNFKGAGPGLGLAIVRGIVEWHQGKVWAESEGYDEEKRPGSQFHIVLPLRQEGLEQVASRPPQNQILLVKSK